MRASSRGQTKRSNTRSDKVVGLRDIVQRNNAIHDETTDRLRQLVRVLAKEKPAQFLAFHGDIGQRQAERILGGWQIVTWPILKALLRSEYSAQFHFLLADSLADVPYWDNERKRLRVENLKAQRRALDLEIEKEQGAQS